VRQLEASVGRHDELAGMVQSIEAFCHRVELGLAEVTFVFLTTENFTAFY